MQTISRYDVFFLSFLSPCWSLARTVLPILNTKPLSHAYSVIIVSLPIDIIERILGPSVTYTQLQRFFIIYLEDLPLLQFQQLWEYSAAFDDCCLILSLDNPNTFKIALEQLSTAGRINRLKDVEAFLAPPYQARVALDLINDGHALKMAANLPRCHTFFTLIAKLIAQEPLANGELYLLDER